MKRPELVLSALALASLLPVLALAQSKQETGTWRAASTTAISITGDIILADEKLYLNFTKYTIAPIRALTPDEAAAMFADSGNTTGSLYRLSIPAKKVLLHKNTLCGSDETQWMVTSVAGKNLQVAFFSGPAMPVFTADAMANATNLCGTYSYAR